MPKDLPEAVREIRLRDGTYKEEAYYFLLEALEITIHGLKKRRHVDGRELLDGVRRLALRRFGPTSRMVFEYWGIRKTDDFGRIVFQLIDAGVLSKTETDSPEDFAGVYDFKTEFEDGYGWTSDYD
jgi:uncharacterized repeat protein (TIGR04138 family)